MGKSTVSMACVDALRLTRPPLEIPIPGERSCSSHKAPQDFPLIKSPRIRHDTLW